jgi:hypothetical protein
MFSPKQLSKITSEAVNRIENERRIEDERIKKLAEEAKVLEDERKAREAEEIIRTRLVEKYKAKVIQEAIKAALLGDKKTNIYVPIEVTDHLKLHFRKYQVWVTTESGSAVYSKLKSRLQTLIDKVSQSISPDVEYFRNLLLTIQAADEDDYFAIERVIHEMEEDKLGYHESAILYFNLQIKPLRDLIENDFDSIEKDELVTIIWHAKDAVDHLITDIEDAASWLTSTSGSGLIQNINISANKSANDGLSQSNFELEKIPVQTERWGSNEMTKVLFKNTPIGIFPFKPMTFEKILNHIGFSTEINNENSKMNLFIRW